MPDSAPSALPAAPDDGAPVFRPGATAVSPDTGEAVQAVPGGPDDPAAAPPKSPFGDMFLWIMIGMIALIFITNRRRGRQQEPSAPLATLKKGDRVVTIGRMHGKVVDLDERTFTIKPDDQAGHTMRFDREALYRIVPRPGEETPDKK